MVHLNLEWATGGKEEKTSAPTPSSSHQLKAKGPNVTFASFRQRLRKEINHGFLLMITTINMALRPQAFCLTWSLNIVFLSQCKPFTDVCNNTTVGPSKHFLLSPPATLLDEGEKKLHVEMTSLLKLLCILWWPSPSRANLAGFN